MEDIFNHGLKEGLVYVCTGLVLKCDVKSHANFANLCLTFNNQIQKLEILKKERKLHLTRK